MNFKRQTVVQIWKRDTILRSDWLSYDDLIDIIKFVPILIILAHITHQRFELRTPGDCDVQSLGGKEGFHVEEVEKVSVSEVRDKLISEAI
jgi:hypothetical protein